MPLQDFRFGVSLVAPRTRSAWQETARQVEDLGYDVLLLADHLGLAAPFPALISAAEVTTQLRLGTLALNAGFYPPALLAREAATLYELTEGRFELGLGAGYEAAEFEAAGLPFPGADQRVDHLGHTVAEVRQILAETGHRVPVLVAGQGDRVLTLAARHADIVNFPGAHNRITPGQASPLAERVDFVRRAAGERFAGIELSTVVPAVIISGSGEPDLAVARHLYPGLTDEELYRQPGVLHGSVASIADSLCELRETCGITYVTVTGNNLEPFGKVIDKLR